MGNAQLAQKTAVQNIPYSQEAEEAVIGAVIVNPNLYIIIAEFLKADDFFLIRHNYIWQALNRLWDRGDDIDYLTIAEELQSLGWLEMIGGPAHLTTLISAAPTSTHGETYAEIVRRAAVRRRLLLAADQIKGLAMNEAKPLEDVVLDAEKLLNDVTQEGVKSTDERIGAVVQRVADDIEKRIQKGGQTHLFLPTGFKDFDAVFYGLERGKYHVLAALTSFGKSLLTLTIAYRMAKQGFGVYLISNEAQKEDMIYRLIGIETGINYKKVRKATDLTPQEQGRVLEAMKNVSELGIVLDYDADLSPKKLRAKFERRRRTTQIDVVIVDGIYNMVADDAGRYRGDRTRELEDISHALLDFPRDTNVAFLATHQVASRIKSRVKKSANGKLTGDARPVGESDLERCSRIGRDADVLMFLHRQSYFDPNTEFPNQTEWIVNKGRDIGTGTISLYFDRGHEGFLDARVQSFDLSNLD